MAVALYALSGVVVVAAVGAIYRINLVMKMRHLLRIARRPPRRRKQHCCTCRPHSAAMMVARGDAMEALLATVSSDSSSRRQLMLKLLQVIVVRARDGLNFVRSEIRFRITLENSLPRARSPQSRSSNEFD